MPPRFRLATSADIGAIVALGNAGRPPGAVVVPDDPDDPRVRAAFAAIEADPGHELIVAEVAGAVVGVLQLSVLPGLTNGGQWRAQLENVHVRADLRERGIGRLLIAHAVERARARGCGLVQLTSNKVRAEAHRFYERLGFVASHQGFKMTL